MLNVVQIICISDNIYINYYIFKIIFFLHIGFFINEILCDYTR